MGRAKLLRWWVRFAVTSDRLATVRRHVGTAGLSAVQERYSTLRAASPTRPIFVNFAGKWALLQDEGS